MSCWATMKTIQPSKDSPDLSSLRNSGFGRHHRYRPVIFTAGGIGGELFGKQRVDAESRKLSCLVFKSDACEDVFAAGFCRFICGAGFPDPFPCFFSADHFEKRDLHVVQFVRRISLPALHDIGQSGARRRCEARRGSRRLSRRGCRQRRQ